MGTTRTSNKDILNAIEAQTAAIGQLVAALSGNQTQVAPEAPAPVVEAQAPVSNETETINVPKNYANHMVGKVKDKVAEDNQPRVLYARRNLAGETKLAYCLLSRLNHVKTHDRGYIGSIQTIEPSA